MGNWLVPEHVLRYSLGVVQIEVVITEFNCINFILNSKWFIPLRHMRLVA